jgi:hypothetical protein
MMSKEIITHKRIIGHSARGEMRVRMHEKKA